MFEYFKGKVEELNPAELILEVNNIAYRLMISLQTYSSIKKEQECKIYIYHHLSENIEVLYGFFSKDERSIFESLISVSGIGPNTARLMLSSLSTNEVRTAIISGDLKKIQSIKGIGLKTAQRVLLELKDKMVKISGSSSSSDFAGDLGSGFAGGASGIIIPNILVKEEASSALVLLGFNKQNVERVVNIILSENPSVKLEELIKASLKKLS